VIGDLLRGCYATLRETLPDDVSECGVFLAGFTWAFLLHWVVLIIVTWSVCSQRGGC
jgi:hypothetical protein